jgi:indole-3-glycerol phosphate synthase
VSQEGLPDVLAAILAATRAIVETRKSACPIERLAAAAAERRPDGPRMIERLARPGSLNVLAECKRRSPSRGVLRADYDAAAIAARYEASGAAAISVLTEPTFFDGSLDDLEDVRERVSLPVLRKDFVIDEYQLVEARAAGADAVLLIVAALGDERLRALHEGARALGLAALVEVHTREDLDRALALSPKLVGVNSRDLRTFRVNPAAALDLVDAIPDEVVAVAESGLNRHEDLRRFRDRGCDAFLVGERLVSSPDPGRALGELLGCS